MCSHVICHDPRPLCSEQIKDISNGVPGLKGCDRSCEGQGRCRILTPGMRRKSHLNRKLIIRDQRKLLMRYKLSAIKKRRLGITNKPSNDYERRVFMLKKSIKKCGNLNMSAKCRRMKAVVAFLAQKYTKGERLLKSLTGVHAERALKLLKSFYRLYDFKSKKVETGRMQPERRMITQLPAKARHLQALFARQKHQEALPKALAKMADDINNGASMQAMLSKASPRWKTVFKMWGRGKFKCWCYDD